MKTETRQRTVVQDYNVYIDKDGKNLLLKVNVSIMKKFLTVPGLSARNVMERKDTEVSG